MAGEKIIRRGMASREGGEVDFGLLFLNLVLFVRVLRGLPLWVLRFGGYCVFGGRRSIVGGASRASCIGVALRCRGVGGWMGRIGTHKAGGGGSAQWVGVLLCGGGQKRLLPNVEVRRDHALAMLGFFSRGNVVLVLLGNGMPVRLGLWHDGESPLTDPFSEQPEIVVRQDIPAEVATKSEDEEHDRFGKAFLRPPLFLESIP
ncbi:hypothetical protein FA13DRAFT_1914029 [Coprinellus micaceus]|uniref:Uncharacterized protein n=1 Tax=Coprinellus micaceus TaxID=71717 RepID=A0A4Y7SPH9_COPMI|nr:hypothetical protein FA13DRAFT_1914029 [Coprinellus micaceus]